MDRVQKILQLIPNEVLPKLSPKVPDRIREIIDHYVMGWDDPQLFDRQFQFIIRGVMENLCLIYDNGNGIKIAVRVSGSCFAPLYKLGTMHIVFSRLMELARNPRVLKIVTRPEEESMLESGEAKWRAIISPGGNCRGLQVLQSGKPIKWDSDWLLDYFENPGVSNRPLMVELDTGEVISLGLSGGGLVQTGVDPEHGPIYEPRPGWREEALSLAAKARIILEHPRVVKMYFGARNAAVRGMTFNELLQYLNSLPQPITMQQPEGPQPSQVQGASQADVVASGQPSQSSSEGAPPEGAIPNRTFISSDWAWCVMKFPNNPVGQQQCLDDLQAKSEWEVQTPEVVSAGVSSGTIVILLLAAWIAYLLLKGR